MCQITLNTVDYLYISNFYTGKPLTTHSSLDSSTLDEPLAVIDLADTEFTILGTAHVSKASATTVKNLVNTGEFDLIAIELCNSRYTAIIDQDSLTRIDIFDAIKNGKLPMISATLALSAFQQRIADQLGVEPGADMRSAVISAQDNDLPIALIDRDIGTTLKRIYRNIPWYNRFKLFAALVTSVFSSQKIDEDEIERLKHGDLIETSFTEFAEQDLDLFEPLIDERDRFMAARLIESAREHQSKNVLAVVGAGHMKGISRYLKESADDPQSARQTIEQLSQIPPPAKWPKYIPWVIVGLILVGFVWGFSHNEALGWSMVQTWVLYNGVLCAIGAAVAGAHPLTISTAFLAAPITSLNPTIGAGMVTAAVEAYFRHPNVKDFSELRHDASTVRGWWKNRVTRILLVFLFSTIGSAVGTWLAIFNFR